MSSITVSAGGFTSGVTPVQVRRSNATAKVGDPESLASNAGTSRMRLTRRGRVVLVALGLALAAGIGSIATQAVAEGPAIEAATTTVIVAPGQTLWSIASSITSPGEDVRDVVNAIADLNAMGNLELRAGDELLLPAS